MTKTNAELYGAAKDNAAKTHCPKGHPYAGNNLCFKTSGNRINRVCRQCVRDRDKVRRTIEELAIVRRESDARHVRIYAAKYPEKAKARSLLSWAIKSKKIVRPAICSQCGSITKVHGHHADYSKPLEVKWLCALCHASEHRANG